jgi:hypothetical protein
MGADENSAPLPVSLISFSGIKLNKDVQLSWVTSSEMNNQYFEVQKSRDNVHFENIGKVKGSGTSTTLNRYFYTDVNAFPSNCNTLFYRLSQVDFDGTFDISKPIIITSLENDQASIPVIHPNPFTNAPILSINHASNGGKARVMVYNVSGILISNFEVDLMEGSNELKLEEMKLLNNGIYLVTITIGEEQSIQRVVKL